MQFINKYGQATDDVQEAVEATRTEVTQAREALFDQIVDGKPWDENCESYRQNMLVDFEIIFIKYRQNKIERNDVVGLLDDSFDKNVGLHCEREA